MKEKDKTNMKSFEIEMTQEQVDYLQRLGMEMDVRYDIVARIIENHKNDIDDAVLTSAVFTKYHHAAAEAKLSYETAKIEFGNTYLQPIVDEKVGKENTPFTWEIPDFSTRIVYITA